MFVDKTKKETQANNQILEFQGALIKEQEREILFYKNKLLALQEENNSLVRSISFKIGFLVTFPFRLIFNYILKVNSSQQNPIKASIDSAYLSKGFIEVSGWALSDSEITTIDVCINNTHEHAILGLFREDVLQSYPEVTNSQHSGFSALIKGTLSDELTVKIKDEENNVVELKKVIFPASEGMNLNSQYKIFLDQNKPRQINQINKLRNKAFIYQPLISIVVPVFNVNVKYLDACVESVLNQFYQNWELCLYDDCSNNENILFCLNSWQSKDKRIKVGLGKANKGIALATNEAIKLAHGEFIALLDNDDELSQDALLLVVDALNLDKDLDFIYSDEDKINNEGVFCDPHFKSDFNLATLTSWNYICHFSVIRKSLGDSVKWFREGFDGAQDYDLFLRLALKTSKFHHIPHVLYHWRKVEGSTALSLNNKSYAIAASKKALQYYLSAKNERASIENGLFPNSFRIKKNYNNSDKVSLIIPFKDEVGLTKACIKSVLTKTSVVDFELLLINNQSTDSELLNYIEKLSHDDSRIHLLDFDESFNYAKLNNWAVNQAANDLVLFLNNDIEVINKDWLSSMLNEIQYHDVAAVGAKLLFQDNTIQHSGVVVSKVGAVHPNKGLDDMAIGYFQRANYVQNVSACTAACLLVKKSIFLEVGGFDEELFAIAYNDVDLCLKMRKAGYLITYTPYAKLYHYESKSRGLDNSPEKLERFTKELKNYQLKWGEIYKDGDPYYNPNLKQTSEQIYLNI